MLRFLLKIIAGDYAEEGQHDREDSLMKVQQLEAENARLETKRDDIAKLLEEYQ